MCSAGPKQHSLNFPVCHRQAVLSPPRLSTWPSAQRGGPFPPKHRPAYQSFSPPVTRNLLSKSPLLTGGCWLGFHYKSWSMASQGQGQAHAGFYHTQSTMNSLSTAYQHTGCKARWTDLELISKLCIFCRCSDRAGV